VARNYAQIMTAIWDNAEFCALEESQQRAYLLLVTQKDISAAGVLPLRLRRWASKATNSTPDRLVQAFKVLEAGRFIVVDWDTEEVLVRSFIRWDGGFNNPKRRPVIIRSADEADSDLIRRHLAAEFARCGLPELPGGPPDSPPPATAVPADSPADSLSGTHPKINKADRKADPFPQVNSLSDRHAASDGVVVTYLATGGATTHNPETTTPTASGAAAPATAQTLVGEWIDSRRRRPPGAVIGQTSKALRAMLEEGIDPDDIRAGLRVWADKGLHPSALPSVVNEVMNAAPTRVPVRPAENKTDARIAALLAGGSGPPAAPHLRAIGGNR